MPTAKIIEVPGKMVAIAKKRTVDIVETFKKSGNKDLLYLATSAYIQGMHDQQEADKQRQLEEVNA